MMTESMATTTKTDDLKKLIYYTRPGSVVAATESKGLAAEMMEI
jgi:hypothetical protein